MVSEQRAIRAIPANGFLHDYVIEWGMNRCDANVGFHIAAGLVLLAQTVPIGFGLPWHGRPLRANFYALLVGESTWSGKSTVVECAERILAQVCPERIMQDPGSRERFTDAIIEHPQQILLLGEFGAFLNSTERGYRNDLRTALTDAYDCPRMSRDTVERKRRNAKTSEEHPRLSVLGGCTPAFLETFTSPVDWEGGFLARFFSILASSEREQNAPPAPMPEVERSLVARLNGYLSGGLERPPGPCLGLSQGAVQAWRAWLVEIRARAHEARPALAAALGRSRTFAAK
ncbi:MAG TPA: DUF3987 domain-containing protein, partial [Stellaceae bacterium]|nr:DUF3987 domain-containing protein [Stellaceae bacterium]